MLHLSHSPPTFPLIPTPPAHQPMVMHLACVLLGLTMEEALVAATLNAAAALGKADRHGSLEVGKFGDMVLINAPR